MTRLWTARLAWPVRSLGPGRRAALWVAGCRRRCPGCITPELLDRGAGRPLPVGRLVERLVSLPIAPHDLSGLTISGGEPFEQAVALAELVRGVRARRPGWNVMAYTGFTIDEIRCRVPHGEELLSELDALIDGPYVAPAPSRDPWSGSGNQHLHVLTERGSAWSDAGARHDPVADVGLGPGGSTWILGVPPASGRHAIRHVLRGQASASGRAAVKGRRR